MEDIIMWITEKLMERILPPKYRDKLLEGWIGVLFTLIMFAIVGSVLVFTLVALIYGLIRLILFIFPFPWLENIIFAIIDFLA